MIQHGILNMDSIYSMLGPADKTITAEADKELNDAKEFVRKVNVVSTNKDGKSDEVCMSFGRNCIMEIHIVIVCLFL